MAFDSLSHTKSEYIYHAVFCALPKKPSVGNLSVHAIPNQFFWLTLENVEDLLDHIKYFGRPCHSGETLDYPWNIGRIKNKYRKKEITIFPI